jgi:putative RNA 2'-phosphotransferase
VSTTSCRGSIRVILTVDAAVMHAAGHAFYQAANGVWLTDHVPTESKGVT